MTSTERTDILDTLAKHRDLFLTAVQGVTDHQAATRTTVSELTLGGLVKHVAAVERQWADFVVHGPSPAQDVDWSSIDWSDPPAYVVDYQNGFRMLDGETLESLLATYAEVGAATDDLVGSVDLDGSQELPPAPWFTPGSRWTARRTFLHIVAETAQHAGHADIIRESLDGQRSMG